MLLDRPTRFWVAHHDRLRRGWNQIKTCYKVIRINNKKPNLIHYISVVRFACSLYNHRWLLYLSFHEVAPKHDQMSNMLNTTMGINNHKLMLQRPLQFWLYPQQPSSHQSKRQTGVNLSEVYHIISHSIP